MKKVFIFLFILILLTATISACGDDNDNTSSTLPNNTSSKSDDTTSQSTDISDEPYVSDTESGDVSTTVSDSVSDTVSTGTDTSGTVSEVGGALSAPYIDIINSGKYMIKMTDVPEMVGAAIQKNDITWYFKNDGYVTEITEYGSKIRTVAEGDYYYTFMHETKTIFKNPIADLITPYIPELTNLTHLNDGVDTVDGVTYDLENFKDSNGKTVTFMFNNGILKKMRSYIPSMDEYAEYGVEIKSSYDQSVFDLPGDYEVVDFS